MKKLLVLTLCLLILIFGVGGCITPRAQKYCPANRPETKWISADDKIEFYVNENGVVKNGKFINEGTEENVNIDVTDHTCRFYMRSEYVDAKYLDEYYLVGVAYYNKYSMEVEVITSVVDEYEKGDVIVFVCYGN